MLLFITGDYFRFKRSFDHEYIIIWKAEKKYHSKDKDLLTKLQE